MSFVLDRSTTTQTPGNVTSFTVGHVIKEKNTDNDTEYVTWKDLCRELTMFWVRERDSAIDGCE